ncbi:MAG: response regulator transcription factor [Ferruginibacter sp.]
MENLSPRRVIIYEDNNHLRDSLYFLINSSTDFICTAGFPNTKQLIANITEQQPELIVMDIEMPGGMNGIEATRLAKKTFPAINIMLLTVFEDSDKIFQALCAGGSGYLLKNSSPEQILQAMSDCMIGGTPLSAQVAKIMVKFFHNNYTRKTTEEYLLTKKEKELLQHLVDGKSYKMIAEGMAISLETVKSHIKNVYRKLHVNCSHEAVVKAIRQQLL